MPALRMTLCLLRWNSLAATQSPPKNSNVTLRMGKTLEALTAPVERRREASVCTLASPGGPSTNDVGVTEGKMALEMASKPTSNMSM